MAHEDRTDASTLIRQLELNPFSFDFFHAVRKLECTHPHLPRIGYSQHPRQDPIRFCQPPSLSFAPSNIVEFQTHAKNAPKLFVNFMGLLGPNGPLPLHMTEYVRERQRHHHDSTLAGFLDIFHHRMISLFYRAWACNHQTVSFDRKESDRFAVYLGSLIGIGMDSLCQRDRVDDLAKLHFSGHLACPTKHADGLASILKGYFGVPVVIEQFVGQWIKLPPDSLCHLGASPRSGTIGQTAIVGSKIWQCQQKFRIKFGPLDLKDFRRLLPGGASLSRLADWIKNYAGMALSWEAQLILKAAQVPQVQLGQQGQLGWSTWLKSQPFKKDTDDVVLESSVA